MSTSWPSTVESELHLQDEAIPDGQLRGHSGDTTEWLRSLAAVEQTSTELSLEAGDVRDRLTRLGADESDIEHVLQLLPLTERPGTRWAISRCRDQLVAAMGSQNRGPGWPMLPGEFGRTFYVYVFLAAVPAVQAFHAEHGVDTETSWASMADLAQQLRVHRTIFGIPGIHTQGWLRLPYQGLLYSLGRLQFNFYRFHHETGPDVPFGDGDLILGTHIPETGPLDADECARSFARADEFFAKHFPDTPVRYTVCSSWLLDPQLADYLSPESNIIRFQRMFTQLSDGKPGDRDVLEFVFRRVGEVDPDSLPQDTTLQRAIVSHLKSGKHWMVQSGWRALGA